MIIAIDGPAASGKGTLAKQLAEYFQLMHLDTGKLYRYMAWYFLQNGTDMTQLTEGAIASAVEAISPARLSKPELLTEQIGQYASQISKNQAVRQALVSIQRTLAQDAHQQEYYQGAVLDGRDIGTVILPDADYKFYLDADLQVRAARRYQESLENGKKTSLEAITALIAARDQQDSQRASSPLKPADDAIFLNSSQMNIEQMVDSAKATIEQNRVE